MNKDMTIGAVKKALRAAFPKRTYVVTVQDWVSYRVTETPKYKSFSITMFHQNYHLNKDMIRPCEQKELLRRYISHWAFLPLEQFDDDTSLKSLRRDFGQVSKMGMIVDATFRGEGDFIHSPDFDDDEVNCLDTVNDFVKFFEDKKIRIDNIAPTGLKNGC